MKIILKRYYFLLLGISTLSPINAISLTKQENKQILLQICQKLKSVRAFDFNCKDCIQQLLSSKEIENAQTRYQFTKEVNKFLSLTGVSHLYLIDNLNNGDLEFYEREHIIEKFSDTKILCPKISLISNPLELKNGMDVYNQLMLCKNEKLISDLMKKINLSHFKKTEYISIPKDKVRIGLEQNDKKIIWHLLKPLKSFPSEQLPFLRISSFMPEGGEQLISDENGFIQSIYPYVRKSIKFFFNLIGEKKSSSLILDLRDNLGGELSETMLLARYGFKAMSPLMYLSLEKKTFKSEDIPHYNLVRDTLIKQLVEYHSSVETYLEQWEKAFIQKNLNIERNSNLGNYFKAYEGKVFILVNKNTRSSGEAFAHQLKTALKEKCMILGAKTAGELTTSEDPFKALNHSFSMFAPTAELIPLMGSLDRIESVGITPDILIDDPGHAAFVITSESSQQDKCIQEAINWINHN